MVKNGVLPLVLDFGRANVTCVGLMKFRLAVVSFVVSSLSIAVKFIATMLVT